MSDKALENAGRRRDELAAAINAAQDRLDELRRELSRVDEFIAEWHRYAGVLADGPHQAAERPASEASPYTIGVGPLPAPAPRATGNSSKEAVTEAALELIAERGEPIGRSELYKLLTERGLIIRGKEPEMVLSTMLWRMKDRIVRLKGGGYWIADRPYEPAQYDKDLEAMFGATDEGAPETTDTD